MAKLYIDAVPTCLGGHALYRIGTPCGEHSAQVWTCGAPECPDYRKKMVVPLVEIECLVIGEFAEGEEIR